MSGNQMEVAVISGRKDVFLSTVGTQRWENAAYDGLNITGNVSKTSGDGSWTDIASIGDDFGGTKLAIPGENLNTY
jgi:hypothetical protein